MFCAKCGAKLEEHDLFCRTCGTPIAEALAQPAQSPVEEDPAIPEESVFNAPPVYPTDDQPAVETSAPAPVKKKKNPLRIILPIVGGLAALAILIVVLVNLVGGAKVKLGKAFANTAKEYAKVADATGLYDSMETYENIEESYSETVELKLKELPAMSELEGLGLRIATGVNLDAREINFTLTPIYASIDIVDAQLYLKDNSLYASVPQLTDGRAYMVNTETLGQNLVEWGVDDELANLSFNIFDLVEFVKENTEPKDEVALAMEKAVADLLLAVEVEKAGKETLSVNDHYLDCDIYNVVIPNAALISFIQALEDASGNVDVQYLYTELMKMMGFSEELVQDVFGNMADLENINPYDELYKGIREMGDVQVQVGVHKKLVVSVSFERTIQDETIRWDLQLGGGTLYVNDLRLEVTNEDVGKIILTSTGDHACSNGVFTDVTTLDIDGEYEDFTFVSELSYTPNADFEWTFRGLDGKVSIHGNISNNNGTTRIEMDTIDFWMYDEHVLCFSMITEFGPYQAMDMDTSNAVEVLTLSEDELFDELMLLEDSVIAWAEDVVLSNPQLIGLLESLMYY